MSNETELDWLARNVHEWPAGDHQPWCYVYMVHGGVIKASGNFLDAVAKPTMITIDQWLARRAELQNKPSWKGAPEWAIALAQDSNGKWFFYADTPTAGQASWCVEGTGDNERSGRGEVLGGWRDTLERRPQAEADITDPFDPEFRPVTVSNETVKLERPIAVAGTGNGSAAESVFLIGRVIDLLRTSVDHFSADELADLNELTGAELTKRDERVCGGQNYLDATWFERGELPPVGARCAALLGIAPKANCEVIAKTERQMVVKWEENGMMDVIDLDVHVAFRPIRTERDELVNVFINHYGNPKGAEGYIGIADAILAAGFSLGAK